MSLPAPPASTSGRRRYRRSEPTSKPDTTGRNLCLFLDGTGNTFGPSSLSNVPRLLALVDADPARQLIYYQSGIGIAYGHLTVFDKIAQIVDEGIAFSLATHIKHAYTWLMNHWKPNDRIFIFGFSRGAFTGRALAGMLQQVGLLPAGNEESVAMAYSIYSGQSGAVLVPGKESLAMGFKRTFSRDVYVHYVGVWDTVSSVGALIPRTLPFASGTKYIRHFRQALALDEHRARFAEQPFISDDAAPTFPDNPSFFALPPETCSIKELWFAGAHSNVGGGEFDYDGDVAPALSHVSLRWMVRESVEAGLSLDSHALSKNPIFAPVFPSAREVVARIVKGYATSEDQPIIDFIHRSKLHNPDIDEEICAVVFLAAQPSPSMDSDAVAPRGDHLSFSIQKPDLRRASFPTRFSLFWQRFGARLKAAMWWLLELAPTLKILWDAEGNRRRWTVASNFGRGRVLPANPTFHSSVRTRMEAKSFQQYGNNENVVETKYQPKARFTNGNSFAEIRFAD
ncbi:hypothetical protein JCM10212_002116 [Sporobolomyces blumeae]